MCHPRGRRPRLAARLIHALLLALVLWPAAGQGDVLVIYPDAPAPFATAFGQIIAGITRGTQQPVTSLALPNPPDPTTVTTWLAGQSEQATMVLLGQPPLRLYPQLGTNRPVIAGGVYQGDAPPALAGVSITPDPALYLEIVRDLLPAATTIIVFYNAQAGGGPPRVAQTAGRTFTLQPVGIEDDVSLVRALSKVLATADPRTSVLWFTENTINLNNELILPYVLDETWSRRIAAFSNSAAHVRHGLLFALYTDFEAHGAELAALLDTPPAQRRPGLTLSRAVRLAFNTRMAQNLSIPLRNKVIERADVLFPSP